MQQIIYTLFIPLFIYTIVNKPEPKCLYINKITPLKKIQDLFETSRMLELQSWRYYGDCSVRHSNNHINKIGNDTTVIWLINNNKTACSEQVADLTMWCNKNDLTVNNNKITLQTSGDTEVSQQRMTPKLQYSRIDGLHYEPCSLSKLILQHKPETVINALGLTFIN